MSKVKTPFYCSKSKKSYAQGDEYKGKRTDLKDLMMSKEEEKAFEEHGSISSVKKTENKKAPETKTGGTEKK